MDRTAFAAYALLVPTLGLSVGCPAKQSPAPEAAAPQVLAELQQGSPGPWRWVAPGTVAPTSLERPAPPDYALPSIEPSDADELRRRMDYANRPKSDGDDSPTPSAGAADVRFAIPDPSTEAAAGVPENELSAMPELVDPMPSALDAPGVVSEPRMLESMVPPPATTSERLPLTIPPLPPERGMLPWAATPASSPEMQAVLEQAEQRLQLGFRLAERGAVYLARSEFLAVLELVAQANDLQRDTQFYTKSLVAGLAALEESRDFVRQRPVGKQLDIERVVSGHRTRILNEDEIASISPLVAARRYYTFAQEQLAGAAAGESRCSIALYGLGKMAATSPEASSAQRMEARRKPWSYTSRP